MPKQTYTGFSGPDLELVAASDTASRAIPPLWPLASSVAVNPFLGQSDQPLPHVAARLARIAGTPVTLPRSWYTDQIDAGAITTTDLEEALAMQKGQGPDSIEALFADVPTASPTALPTVADLAAEVSGIDWPSLIEDRIGTWAAGYFDEGQALWQVDQTQNALDSWQAFASRDLTPEIAGLNGFARRVSQLSGGAHSALVHACHDLGLSTDAADTYFHQLLLGLGGWSQVARYRLWQAELVGSTDATTTDMLAIRLQWDAALFAQYAPQISTRWADVVAAHAEPLAPTPQDFTDAILQEAAERAAQRKLAATLAETGIPKRQTRPALQAAFCIDVRSEVFRRALESLDDGIQTLGFAGFFGLTPAHNGFASDVAEKRLPVLLNPGTTSTSGDESSKVADEAARLSARAKRAWGRFKLAAVSSFAFVEATGPVYAGKLLRDALGLSANAVPNEPKPQLDPGMTIEGRISAATGILKAMSLTQDFAPMVLLLGHGANVVNNPHASALHCGACGGYSGEVNARLLAGLLNDKEVRAGLAVAGVTIPDDTVFVAGLHDTTTDAVTLYLQDQSLSGQTKTLSAAQDWLAAAGNLARTERALRLPRATTGQDVTKRSRDWAEVRPEWALAGCSAFVAAPRSRTRGKALQGRAFLHDYTWAEDEGFGVLELIMTAPVVVASWISLQYYGSVVAPNVFGAGNKLLHNVTGGVGVVEGNGGALRTGLPWQSVHDGEGYAHDPLRLSVCIEAPIEAMTDVLRKHDGVRDLFDNRWLHLIALDRSGQMASRYIGNLEWEPITPNEGVSPKIAA